MLHWPGSDVAIKGKRPSLYEPFTDEITSEQRVNKILGWLDRNRDVNLAVIYLTEVDHAGHLNGPNSIELKHALQSADKAIGDLLKGLEVKGKIEDYNFVVVSDHGMSEASESRHIYLDQIIPTLNDLVLWSDYGPVTSLIPKKGHESELKSRIRAAIRKKHLPVRMFTEDNMPTAYKYAGNSRIAPIVLEAKMGWSVNSIEEKIKLNGLHGYGRSVREMDGILIANGPSFRKNPIPSYPFHSNLDVYPLLCQLLDIIPLPNNGTNTLSAKALYSPRNVHV